MKYGLRENNIKFNFQNAKDKDVIIRNAISNKLSNGISRFYFDGKGDFDNECYEILTNLRKINPQIKLIYVDNYNNFQSLLYSVNLTKFDETIFIKNLYSTSNYDVFGDIAVYEDEKILKFFRNTQTVE